MSTDQMDAYVKLDQDMMADIFQRYILADKSAEIIEIEQRPTYTQQIKNIEEYYQTFDDTTSPLYSNIKDKFRKEIQESRKKIDEEGAIQARQDVVYDQLAEINELQ
jgi:hypothetical protein